MRWIKYILLFLAVIGAGYLSSGVGLNPYLRILACMIVGAVGSLTLSEIEQRKEDEKNARHMAGLATYCCGQAKK
jgi:4-hydroxybenzoate polyprenyltransferase